MSHNIEFDKNAICDGCGYIGAYDLMGDYICDECLKKATDMARPFEDVLNDM